MQHGVYHLLLAVTSRVTAGTAAKIQLPVNTVVRRSDIEMLLTNGL